MAPGCLVAAHDDRMLALLLSAVLAWPVTFPGGSTVTLSLRDDDPNDPYTYFRPETVFNPQHSYAAVSNCGTAGANLDSCRFFLVGPSFGSRPLPQGQMSGLPGLEWTLDGKYLIAVGDTSVRLWNLNGGVRGIIPEIPVPPPEQRLFHTIKSMDLRGQWLCLQMEFEVGVQVYASPNPEPPGGSANPDVHRVEVRQAYRWPALRRGTAADDRQCQRNESVSSPWPSSAST